MNLKYGDWIKENKTKNIFFVDKVGPRIVKGYRILDIGSKNSEYQHGQLGNFSQSLRVKDIKKIKKR